MSFMRLPGIVLVIFASGTQRNLRIFLRQHTRRTITLGNTVDDQQLGVSWTAGALISISLAGFLNFIDPELGQVSKTVHGHNKPITAITLSGDKKWLFTSDFEGHISKNFILCVLVFIIIVNFLSSCFRRTRCCSNDKFSRTRSNKPRRPNSFQTASRPVSPMHFRTTDELEEEEDKSSLASFSSHYESKMSSPPLPHRRAGVIMGVRALGCPQHKNMCVLSCPSRGSYPKMKEYEPPKLMLELKPNLLERESSSRTSDSIIKDMPTLEKEEQKDKAEFSKYASVKLRQRAEVPHLLNLQDDEQTPKDVYPRKAEPLSAINNCFDMSALDFDLFVLDAPNRLFYLSIFDLKEMGLLQIEYVAEDDTLADISLKEATSASLRTSNAIILGTLFRFLTFYIYCFKSESFSKKLRESLIYIMYAHISLVNIIDLMFTVLISLIFVANGAWVLGVTWCHINATMQEFCQLYTLLSIMLMAVERAVGVVTGTAALLPNQRGIDDAKLLSGKRIAVLSLSLAVVATAISLPIVTTVIPVKEYKNRYLFFTVKTLEKIIYRRLMSGNYSGAPLGYPIARMVIYCGSLCVLLICIGAILRKREMYSLPSQSHEYSDFIKRNRAMQDHISRAKLVCFSI
uniref:G_PROTEIN_RECEP_F1_2 domain-containing protein n=1 Tax=Heterorhabditis bacteriophora TaxID=37862 RepID=A0A1I7XM82_HETBA